MMNVATAAGSNELVANVNSAEKSHHDETLEHPPSSGQISENDEPSEPQLHLRTIL